MRRFLPAAAAAVLLSGCATALPGDAGAPPSALATFSAAQHASEVRDCVVQQGARSGVPIGDFEYTLDGGFRYLSRETRALLVEVVEQGGGSRITLDRANGGVLAEIVSGCGGSPRSS